MVAEAKTIFNRRCDLGAFLRACRAELSELELGGALRQIPEHFRQAAHSQVWFSDLQSPGFLPPYFIRTA
jgi:hypothetical protein